MEDSIDRILKLFKADRPRFDVGVDLARLWRTELRNFSDDDLQEAAHILLRKRTYPSLGAMLEALSKVTGDETLTAGKAGASRIYDRDPFQVMQTILQECAPSVFDPYTNHEEQIRLYREWRSGPGPHRLDAPDSWRSKDGKLPDHLWPSKLLQHCDQVAGIPVEIDTPTIEPIQGEYGSDHPAERDLGLWMHYWPDPMPEPDRAKYLAAVERCGLPEHKKAKMRRAALGNYEAQRKAGLGAAIRALTPLGG